MQGHNSSGGSSGSSPGGQSRAVIAIGVGALAIVLLVVLLVDRDRAVPDTGEGDKLPTVEQLVDGPAAKASPETTPSTLPTAATVVIDEADAALARLPLVAERPDAHVGETVRCRNVVPALPVEWSVEGPGVATLLQRTGETFAPHRLTLVCEASNLRVVLVHAFFAQERAADLPVLGRGGIAELKVLGAGPTGVLLAQALRVVDAPPEPTDTGRADLIAALLRGEAAAGSEVTCITDGGATLISTNRLQDAERAGLTRSMAASGAANVDNAADAGAEPADSAGDGPGDGLGVVAELRCQDRGGAAVPALVTIPRARAVELLGVRGGTVLTLRLGGAARNRLMASVVRVVSGAVPVADGELRRVLLEGKAAVGAIVNCVSMGLPLPEAIGRDGIGDVDPYAEGREQTRAWLVCRQAVAPPTHVSLYFALGQGGKLLEIGRGTAVRLRVLGADDQRLHAELAEIVRDPLDERSHATDTRRFVLDRDRLAGKPLACKVGRVEPLRTTPGAPRPGARLILDRAMLDKVDPTPLRVECVDTLRPFDGQGFEVYFASAEARAQAPLRVGAEVELRFAGVRQNVAIAAFGAGRKGDAAR